MAFFDVPTGDQIQPESAQLLEEYRKLAGTAEAPRSHRTYRRITPIVETRLRAELNLHDQWSFPKQTKYVAAMLIAHARRSASAMRARSRCWSPRPTPSAPAASSPASSLPVRERGSWSTDSGASAARPPRHTLDGAERHRHPPDRARPANQSRFSAWTSRRSSTCA